MDIEIFNYMRMALEEAFSAIGESRPNPAVGAVVVKDGVVVGRGRTQRPGSAHAEVMALRDAGDMARGAAIYVTLEPCCHYGRTPPCTKAIIEAGIKEVYYAHGDPNPVVRGNSRSILEAAGIIVYEGLDACIRACAVEEQQSFHGECQVFGYSSYPNEKDYQLEGKTVFADIQRFFEAYDYFVREKRTFVELKSAVTQDGFMGSILEGGIHAPLKITGQGANCWNHELRAMSDAILVGAGTLLADNPSLDVRYAYGNNPKRILWAGHRMFSENEISSLKIFATDVLVYTCVSQSALEKCEKVELVKLGGSTFAANWESMLADLYGRGMHRLMVEPGAKLVCQIFECGLWNRLNLWQSSTFVENGLPYPDLPTNMVAKESAMIGSDVLTVYYH